MPKKKLQAAIARNGGAVANVVTKHEKLSEEELRVAAFNARDNQNASITDKMANDNRRNTLLSEMGFDWFDIEDIKPNPNNTYKITEEDVKNLAGLIYNSKEVEPLILRETEDGVQIVDGERRWWVMSKQNSSCTRVTWVSETSLRPKELKVLRF